MHSPVQPSGDEPTGVTVVSPCGREFQPTVLNLDTIARHPVDLDALPVRLPLESGGHALRHNTRNATHQTMILLPFSANAPFYEILCGDFN